ncbi:MAG: mevalonate kinase [Myxococcaceae bacterium]
MKRVLSAPGKLFFAGEYAVLWGGVARIAAVGPRAFAAVRRREDREVRLLLQEGALSGTLTPSGVKWQQSPPPGFRFAARAVDCVVAAHPKESLGFDLALSPSEEAAPGRKLGIGSSARATVLSCEATRWVLEARVDVLKLALLAHSEVQGGKGSGGDVAASFTGGLVRYRRYNMAALSPLAIVQAPPVDALRVPVGELFLTYAFAGESASTEKWIGDVESRLDESARYRFVAQSDALGDALERALLEGRFREAAEAMGELHRLLCTLGPLETEGMRRVLTLARTCGSAGKLSGAGGGDGVLLLSPDAEARESLLETLRARAMFALPMSLEPGLRGEAEVPPVLQAWMR